MTQGDAAEAPEQDRAGDEPEEDASTEESEHREAPAGDSFRKHLVLGPEEFHLFRDYIHQHSGIYLNEDKLDSLRISLLARASLLDLQDYGSYYQILVSNEREFAELMNLVTINETSFFRFPQQFDAFRNRVVPEIVSRSKEDAPAIRVWSAGCSTGEEPYSIAIAADEALTQMGRYARVHVVGTDVSQKALSTARRAAYNEKKMANVPSRVIDKYFDVAGESCRVGARIRDMVEFRYHNLAQEPYPMSVLGTWDVIFCRNVTIYFKAESTKRVVSNFFRVLADGGYLFIGHSETLQLLSDDFTPVELDGVFLYKKLADTSKRTFGFLGSMPKIEPKHTSKLVVGRDGASVTERIEPLAEPQGGWEIEPAGDEGFSEELDEDLVNATAHLRRGFIYADDGRYDDALAECRRAIELDSLLAPAHYVLGIIDQQRGEEREAIAEFKRTVYIDSGFALAHFQLAQLLKVAGDASGARREFGAALEAIRRNPEGDWTEFLGGFDKGLLAQTCERGLKDLQKA
jgi:chemotaxis protein methyltransferase CheR